VLPLLLLWAAATPLEDAEAALFAGDLAAVEIALSRAEPGPRRDRLRLDAAVLVQDFVAAPRIANELAAAPGWQIHAARAMGHLETLRTRRWLARTGLGMFALALAMLAIGGARELLRPRLETIVGAIGLGLALLLGRSAGPVFGEVLALAGATLLAVLHAAFATFARTSPGARGRAVLMALVLLAAGGVVLSTLATVRPFEIVARGLASSRG
jgi:hypothetical protein